MNFEKLDWARIAAALLAAIVTGGAALYGVYLKSREATAAGYETLAPEINRIKGELETIREENQQLRDALARATGTKAAAPPVVATGTEGRTVARRRRAAGDQAPSQPPATPAGTDAGSPTVASGPPTPPAEQPPVRPGEPDVIGDIKKRVPIDFEKAIRIWKEVQTIRKNPPPQN